MQLAERVQIIGCGLLGASLGLALKERGLAGRVIGVGRNQSTLDKALASCAIDEATLELDASLGKADLIVLAAPVAKSIELLGELAALVSPRAVITDVGSTKGAICARAESFWPQSRRFVGAHPMAGSEKSGPEHARASLYENAVCLVEEHPSLDAEAVALVVALWEGVGAKVVRVESEQHDAMLAYTSHLPHVVAACVAMLAERQGDVSGFIGNGFRDTTRIAASRPEVWTEICLTNRKALLEGLRAYDAEMTAFREALLRKDETAIEAFFARGKASREGICPP